MWLLILAAALIVQVVILRSIATRMVAPHLPFWADQVQYLTEAYRGYDFIRAHGLFTGTIEAIRQPRPQGWLLQTAASWLMTVVGPSRLAALDLNIALAVLWLGVTGYAVKRAFGGPASVLAIGLLLSAGSFTLGPGGPYDFRIDFASMCIWGSLVVLMAVADGREGWGLRIAMLLVGVLLITTRFISSFYLMPFVGLVFLLSLLPIWRRDRSWWQRGAPWFIMGAIWTAVFGLVLYLSYDQFSAYYIRGHIVSDEASVRRIAAGLLSFSDDVIYYPRALWNLHLGTTFLWIAGVILAASLVTAVAVRVLVLVARTGWGNVVHSWLNMFFLPPETEDAQRSRRLWWFLLVVVIGFVSPYLVLTTNRDKNVPVAGVLVPSVALLIVVGAVWLTRLSGRVFRDGPGLSRTLIGHAVGVVVIVVALEAQWQRIQPGPLGLPPAPILQSYAQLMDDASPYIAQMGDRPISWSLDGHYVEISYSTIGVLLYERTGRWINLTGGLGYGSVEQKLEAAELRKAAEGSDVLILSKYPPGTKMPYPYDQSIRDQHEILESYAREHLTLLGTYEMQNMQLQLYVRPIAAGQAGGQDTALAQR